MCGLMCWARGYHLELVRTVQNSLLFASSQGISAAISDRTPWAKSQNGGLVFLARSRKDAPIEYPG